MSDELGRSDLRVLLEWAQVQLDCVDDDSATDWGQGYRHAMGEVVYQIGRRLNG